MTHAYLVGSVAVKSPDQWAEYKRQVPATLAPWGAELVFRGTKVAALAGDSPFTDIVTIRFPDAAAVEAWHSSPAYQALVPLRQLAADVVLVCYEG